MQGSDGDALFDQRRRRLHVHHLGAARIADRPDAADEQQRIFVDGERGIVDAGVIILRSVEHHRAPFECIGILADWRDSAG